MTKREHKYFYGKSFSVKRYRWQLFTEPPKPPKEFELTWESPGIAWMFPIIKNKRINIRNACRVGQRRKSGIVFRDGLLQIQHHRRFKLQQFLDLHPSNKKNVRANSEFRWGAGGA